MIGLQFTQQGKIVKVNRMEMCESFDTSKVKITKVLLTPEDFRTLLGDDTAIYPVIPGRIAIGQISDASEGSYLIKGTRVYINPVNNCNECVDCLSGNENSCADFKRAGKNVNGYLRDFAVVNNSQLYFLPPSVKDNEALLIDYIALALNAIDKLNISKGEHVAVIGGGIIGLIISMLIIYYQAVPILIDGKSENLEQAKLAGVYYNLFSDNKVEKEVNELTGAHMAQKVIYVSDSNINTDLAIKLAAYNAKVGFVGFSSPTLKVNFNLAMRKQLEFCCITSGFGSTEQAINLIANKVLDLSLFNFECIKYEGCETKIKKCAKDLKDGTETVLPVLVDMM
ncbi:MAG: alcohol dehydrogenase catalytic domain-containing protein [Clostridia bacterium]|nr:alcohol dehydrogenase catalytic domain-containing protein [Clostridia bacterium]